MSIFAKYTGGQAGGGGGGSGANTALSNLVNPTSLNQSLNFQSGMTINDSLQNPSYDPNVRQIIVSDGTTIIDAVNEQLIDDNTGNVVLDWKLNQLYRVNNGQIQLDWLAGNLFNDGQLTVDWINQLLVNSSITVLNWSTNQITDNGSNLSIDWSLRNLYDVNGTLAASWAGSVLDGLFAVQHFGNANTATASTLGTVVRKMEIFDASGNSLGFIPIYNSIT